jgi:indolepyruvate ferredoxin oxidoreductase
MDRNSRPITTWAGRGCLVSAGAFVGASHVFTNLGTGPYAHSGSLAIRAAIAA